MNIKLITGLILLLIPFSGLFVWAGIEEGFLKTTVIFAGAFATAAWILLGTYLLVEGFFE